MTDQPNVLLIMADQLTPFALGAYGHAVVQSPNIDALARHGVVIDSAYCNSPLCAPSRFSLMSGRLASRIGAYDNAAYFPSSVPTLAHHLRAKGYDTSLIGKMHFVGPDQLHGFEERRTTDIYPADFGWTPDWSSAARIDWWYHNMASVLEAGVAETSNQLDFDDEVGFQARRKLHDIARNGETRPFFCCVSFSHPHDPYVTRPAYWERYAGADIDLPRVAAIPYQDMDPHSRRLHDVADMADAVIGEAQIRNARRAYYGNVAYVDDWVGRLLATLAATGLAGNTLVIFMSDHGDMLGERGLWYKMSFHEWSCRIPLIFHWPGTLAPARVANNVAAVDLLPTLDALSGGPAAGAPGDLDGRSLSALLAGRTEGDSDTALAEYLGEGAVAPLFMVRQGRWKYVVCEADPAQLFDLEADPDELTNLAGRPEVAETEAALARQAAGRWDAAAIHDQVLADQRRRRFLDGALRQGRYSAWDFQPREDAGQRYMRNHLDLNEVESKARWPRRPPPG